MRLVLCVTGASGAVYARRLLEVAGSLQQRRIEGLPAGETLHLDWVASANAPSVWREELGEDMPADAGEPGIRRWERRDFRAPFASGSNAPDAAVCMPCSMSTLARVAHGGGDDLIARTCEVALKERRKLILVVRETPLSLVHLRNMVAAAEAGALILPAVPSFYGGVQNLADAVDTVVSRVLDQVGLPVDLSHRWGGEGS